MFVIEAKKRDKKTKPAILKKSGLIPAIFYGVKYPTDHISIDLKKFKKIWQEIGESSTVQILVEDIEGPQKNKDENKDENKEINALIHDVQLDPVTDQPIHVDFLVIDLHKKIKVKVPLDFFGTSEAVKNGLGMFVKVLHEVEIEALPENLPHNIKVDISKLVTLDDKISVSDIDLPKGISMITNPANIVASIVVKKEEKEEAPVDLSKIEVEKRGKEEKEITPEEKERK